MKLNKYDSVSEAINSLRERGYKDELKYQEEKDLMYLPESKKEYSAEDLQIVEYHRFEGMSNPSDLSILFAVESTDADKLKAIVVSSYGAYADLKLIEFLDKVKIQERSVK